jgi:hypothetical protein
MPPYINRSLRKRPLALNLPISGPERVTISLSRPTHGSPALWLIGGRNEASVLPEHCSGSGEAKR